MFELAAIAGVLYLLYKSGSDLSDKLTFEPAGLDLKKGILSLRLKNPTENSATVKNVQGSIYSNKIKVGSYFIKQAFTIPSFSAIVIDVKIDLDKVEVFNQITQTLKTGASPKITITGIIGTSFGNIPFDNTIIESTKLINAKK